MQELCNAFKDAAISFEETGFKVRRFASDLLDTLIIICLPGTLAQIHVRMERSRFRLRKPRPYLGARLCCMAYRGLIKWDGERWVRT